MEMKNYWSQSRHHLGCFSTILALSAGSLVAETKPVSLDDCVKMALQKNLDIRIAFYSPRQALSQLRQVSAAYDPSLQFSAGQSFTAQPSLALPGQAALPGAEAWRESYTTAINGLVPWGTTYNIGFDVPRSSDSVRPENGFLYNPSLRLRTAQPLLKNFWIDQPRMMIAVNTLNIRRTEQDVQDLVITVATQVALAYHDLIAARESVKVQTKAVETSERRLVEQKKRVEVGALAPLDEKRSEAEVFRTRADLLRTQGSYGDALTRLRTLTSDNLSEMDGVILDPTQTLTAVPMAFDKKDSWHKALTQRPDVQRATLSLEQQKIRSRFAHNQLFPQLDLNGSYGLNGFDHHLGSSLDNIGARDFPNYSVGLVLNFPLNNRSARESNKQVKLERERLLLDFKRTEQGAMREIDISIRAAKTQFERVGATRKQREFAAQALDAEDKKLANGKSTSFEVLQLQRDLTQSESDEISALSEYNKELYRLAQAEGDTLNKLKILLDIQ